MLTEGIIWKGVLFVVPTPDDCFNTAVGCDELMLIGGTSVTQQFLVADCQTMAWLHTFHKIILWHTTCRTAWNCGVVIPDLQNTSMKLEAYLFASPWAKEASRFSYSCSAFWWHCCDFYSIHICFIKNLVAHYLWNVALAHPKMARQGEVIPRKGSERRRKEWYCNDHYTISARCLDLYSDVDCSYISQNVIVGY